MQQSINESTQNNNFKDFLPKIVVSRINRAEWRKNPYKYQNWGNWLHRMSAYVGRIKPAMAHLIIKASSRMGDKILDPFCGVGTVPLEADLLGRIGIGIDLNPYAYTISKAKLNRNALNEELAWLDALKIDTSKVDLKNCSEYMKTYYHKDTLKEILFIKDFLVKEKKDFLLGCLLGIIHGHRPGHLSAVTSLVIPYAPKGKPEYREVIPRLKEKVIRMNRDGFNTKTKSKAYFADSRKIPLKKDSVDLVISSPPYFNTLDYVNDNRLRLEFLGFNIDKREELKKDLIQDRYNYLDDMEKVGKQLIRVIKNQGFCIFILGDLHSGNKIINTAEEVQKIYEPLGFRTHAIINDAMPENKCIPSNFKRKKLDRILIMTNEKNGIHKR